MTASVATSFFTVEYVKTSNSQTHLIEVDLKLYFDLIERNRRWKEKVIF